MANKRRRFSDALVSGRNCSRNCPEEFIAAQPLPRVLSEDRWEPIGLSVLDARIGGGLPVGRCSEFFGSLSGGSTNLAIRLMSEVTASGRSVGWIDPHDVFDPEACSRFGSCLQEVLRVSPPGPCYNHWMQRRVLLRSGDFPLVVLDLQPRVEVALQWVSTRPWHVGCCGGGSVESGGHDKTGPHSCFFPAPPPVWKVFLRPCAWNALRPELIWASGSRGSKFPSGIAVVGQGPPISGRIGIRGLRFFSDVSLRQSLHSGFSGSGSAASGAGTARCFAPVDTFRARPHSRNPGFFVVRQKRWLVVRRRE